MNENNTSTQITKSTEHNVRDEAFLSLRNLVKVYPNGEKAVFDFNLDIQKNEFIVIVGPSGCGKSTTLRMIAGLEDVSDGDIYMQNELLNYKECKDRKMAIVFQNYALYPQFNVFSNIAFPLTINKYSMPIVNTVLRADLEIQNLINTVETHKLVGVLYNMAHSSTKGMSKGDSIAYILNIIPEAGKILADCFVPYARLPFEELEAKYDEILKAIKDKSAEFVAKEKAQLSEHHISYNEEFCELDENGKIKTEERKLTAFEIRKKVYGAAEQLDLVPYLDKLPKELSGGQMQRVALGRAIVKDVPVFLMDEPLSNLDAKLRLTMRSEIVKLHNKINATTLYVTHDQTEAMTMATRIVAMSKGFVQQIGSPKEIYNNPNNIFVAKFIGTPPMNILNLAFDREEKTLSCGSVKVNVDEKFIKAHDKFYAENVAKFNGLVENFDGSANDEVLRILSATGEKFETMQGKKHKFWSIANFKNLLGKLKKKDKNAPPPENPRKKIAESKLAELKSACSDKHHLLCGIRPERVKVEKYDSKKHDGKAGIIVLKPVVCELLGSEYNLHFELNGKSFVAQFDAKEIMNSNDSMAVSFDFCDMYIFDPITGDGIKA